MAENNAGDDSFNWWGSWISSAREKSASVLEAVKKDLGEISSAVKTEVSNAGVMIGETLRLDEPESTVSTVKRSLSTFIGQVTEVLVPSQEDEDTEAVLITANGAVTLTGFQKHLAELQMNDDTYLKPPNDLSENYKRWMEVVEQDQFTQHHLTKHLASSEILNEKYLTLVPEQVSHMEFWQRYLFKKAILEDALANAEIAERKAKAEQESLNAIVSNKTIIQTDQPKKIIDERDLSNLVLDSEVEVTPEKDDVKWDAEDFGTEEITEEEQARLLQEYEKEMQERDSRKNPIDDKKKVNNKQTKTKASQNNVKYPSKSSNVLETDKPKPENCSKKAPKKDNVVNNAKSKQIQQQTKLIDDDNKNDSIEPIQKEHFAPEIKDDAASDESWEKDFDLTDK